MEIELTQGQSCILDDGDAYLIRGFKWHAHRNKYTYYAEACVWRDGKPKTIKMHRLITHAGDGEEVDHINRNGLDNRRSNLRIATPTQQRLNTRMFRHNTSGIRGVSFHKATGKWQAFYGPSKYLGLFDTREKAIVAREQYVAALDGEDDLSKLATQQKPNQEDMENA